MMLGLRDYVRKNGFPGIVLGLSGGIDSALTAAVAVDALGAEAVRGVRLPSRFTSDASQDDAAESARLLGIALDTVAIEAPTSLWERRKARCSSPGPAEASRLKPLPQESGARADFFVGAPEDAMRFARFCGSIAAEGAPTTTPHPPT